MNPNNNADRRPVYVTGHKNPDTDSVCAAITYANLKNTLYGDHYIACRAGLLNEETQFVLSYFGVDDPPYIKDVRTRIRDIEVRQMEAAAPGESIKSAGSRMHDANVTSLCVAEDEHLKGIVTMTDIVETYMEIRDPHFLSRSGASVGSVVEALDGELLSGDASKKITSGKVVLAPTFEDKDSTPEKDDIVIIDGRDGIPVKIMDSGVSCIILCGESDNTDELCKLAAKRNIQLIRTGHEMFIAANLISQSIPVGHVMKHEKLTTFHQDDFLSDVKEVMSAARFKYFPVLDRLDRYVGMVSHRNLLGASKNKMILVDHNERSQAVKGLEDAEILEIIDHHRLGSIETSGPIFCRNQPLGSTCTIIYLMYHENGVEINRTMAGLMLSAILSDTLMFRSPTCTETDREAADVLAKIAGIDCESYGKEMFRAGAKLSEKTADEIIHLDFKVFSVDGQSIGIGQINSMSDDELEELKERLMPEMEPARSRDGLDMLFFMLTNIIEASSDVIYAGPRALFTLEDAFGQESKDGIVSLPGVVSRKKQFLLTLVETLQK